MSNKRYINSFLKYNESKSISDSTEVFSDKVWKIVEPDILNKKDNSYIFDISEEDFKVKDLKINIKYKKSFENRCNAVTNNNSSDVKDSTLINVVINIEISYKNLDYEFMNYINSVIFHEILHVFQLYNLRVNNKFRPESWSIGGILPKLRNIVNSQYTTYILDLIYFSLSHEISAQLHQYYLYRRSGKDYKRLEEIKIKLHSFKVKKLTEKESEELILIKNEFINSIKYFTTNKKYLKNIEKSIWSESDLNRFLEKLKELFDRRVKYIDKKIKLVDSKFIINYAETISLPSDYLIGNWEEHDKFRFISENLNDCEMVYFI